MTSGPALATFWHGANLPRLDQSCLLSFVHAGYDVTVYSYDPIPGVPGGLTQCDARSVADRRFLDRFRIGGRPSLSHFTDYFRYRLFQETDATWIDTDVLCLRPFAVPADRHFLTRETATSLNGAISHLVRTDGLIDTLIAETTALADTPMTWGATGPALITRILGPDALASAAPPERFYPIHWNAWWKPFLPSERAWCEATTAGSHALHLWNNIVERSGYWKDLAPPHGSFLHAAFDRLGLIGLFREVMPEAVMRKIVENDINLRSADHMPMRRLARILASRASRKIRWSGSPAAP